MVRRFLRTHGLASVLVFAFCFVVTRAFAGQVAPGAGPASTGASAPALHWILIASGLFAYVATLFDPANAETPFDWPPAWRAAAFGLAGALVGVCHYIQNNATQPLSTSVAVGVATILVPALLHFAPSLMKLGGRAGSTILMVGGLGGLAVSQTGCSWIQAEVAKNPTVVMADVELAENVANDGAESLWPIVLAQLPAAQQAAAQANFAKAEATFQDVLSTQNDALAAYQDGASANWAQLISDGIKAADDLIAVIDLYGGSIPKIGSAGAPASSGVYADARAKLEVRRLALHRYAH